MLRERQALNDKMKKTPEIGKSNQTLKILKTRNIKERKYPQPRPSPPAAPPLEAVRNHSKEKFNLKNIREQYKFSKSEEKIDKIPPASKTEPSTHMLEVEIFIECRGASISGFNNAELNGCFIELFCPANLCNFHTDCSSLCGKLSYPLVHQGHHELSRAISH